MPLDLLVIVVAGCMMLLSIYAWLTFGLAMAIVKKSRRFNLRQLLAAMTIVAIVTGLAGAAMR
jgi:hypothetical protein